MMVSLDGYIEGPNKELDWHHVDDEWNQYGMELLHSIDTILFGRTCYQLFESFWPKAEIDPKTTKDNIVIAHAINTMQKIVFSKTLNAVQEADHWKNIQLKNEVVPEEIIQLKKAPGKDMVIFGGAGIAQSFMKHNLIDEYRIFVNPLALGNGKPLFAKAAERMNLKFLKTKPFRSGLVGLYYQPL